MSDIFEERLMRNIKRRDRAMSLCHPCKTCNSEQVQLVDWLGAKFKYRCRKCRAEWYSVPHE